MGLPRNGEFERDRQFPGNSLDISPGTAQAEESHK